MPLLLALAFISGVPPLVYQVVWTRQVELLVGAQAQAIAIVVSTFFAGLAFGAFYFGRRADGSGNPLRLYAGLEAGAAAFALAAFLGLSALDASVRVPGPLRLAGSALAILPCTALLGGTLPALLRAAGGPSAVVRVAGRLVALNTAGALLGVALAALCVPVLGLRATLGAAVCLALGVALAARGLARPRAAQVLSPLRSARVPPDLLLAAGLAGAASLAFEVLVARAAALQLGSSLWAWALVLGLFLLALALGNALAATRAAATASAAAELGWIQLALAASVLACAVGGVPDAATPAAGLSIASVGLLALAVLPPVTLMGAAFPYFVRLAIEGGDALAARFGAISSANTAGGIVGSCLAPFVLLPALGLRGAFAACALVGVGLGIRFLGLAPARRTLAVALAASVPAFGVLTSLLLRDVGGPGRLLLFASHGAQASVAVVREGDRRDLYVDGDPEASTGGPARVTEEWLALLPLSLHPGPRRVLEVGLGSGITLGTAARFPFETLACFELVGEVLEASRFFAPQNGAVVDRAAHDPRVTIRVVDGRAALLREAGRWDVILANTVHPGSLGATGLYSREYHERVLRALAPGGIATQWLPLELSEPAFAALLRTFFEVVPHGALWWGADNVLLVGGAAPLPSASEARMAALRAHAPEALARLGLERLTDLEALEIADAGTVRSVLGAGEVLLDDRPRLEAWGEGARGLPSGGFRVLEQIALEAARRNPRRGAMLLFVQAGAARALGDTERADGLERLAEQAGLQLARRARIERTSGAARAHFREQRFDDAVAGFRGVLGEAPWHEPSRFGLAAALYRAGRADGALPELEQLVREPGEHAQAWNLLGALRAEAGDALGARQAFERALEADPWYPEALLNAGRLAEAGGDTAAASALRARHAALGDD